MPFTWTALVWISHIQKGNSPPSTTNKSKLTHSIALSKEDCWLCNEVLIFYYRVLILVAMTTTSIFRFCVAVTLIQWRMQDLLKGDSSIIMRAKRARKFRSHAHFWLKPRPFLIILERNFLPHHVNCPVFDRDFWYSMLRWAVFLVLWPERGVPLSPLSVVVSTRSSPKGGFLCTPGSPSGSATVICIIIETNIEPKILYPVLYYWRQS